MNKTLIIDGIMLIMSGIILFDVSGITSILLIGIGILFIIGGLKRDKKHIRK